LNSDLWRSAIITSFYILVIFLVAWYAHIRKESGRSIVNSPYIYTLSVAVYCTAWTFYGSVGKAATSGIDFAMIYIGPTLVATSWFLVLKHVIRICKEHNVTSIADFISLRYGKSLWLGSLTTLVILVGCMPYIAVQIKAVSTSFYIISGLNPHNIFFSGGEAELRIPTGFFLTLIIAVFSIIFGARKLSSSERHEGMVAAVAFESLLKLLVVFIIGILISFHLFDGPGDLFSKFASMYPADFARLFSLSSADRSPDTVHPFSMLIMSMGAFMMLPRQFHVMVIENSDERHIATSMWLFPLYLFLISIFVLPIALGGAIITGSTDGADFFIINIPQKTGHGCFAIIAFLGGLSAAAGMVIVESIAISTMMLNHIFMPLIVKLKPRNWFPLLLINLKRAAIIITIMLGYFYFQIAGDVLSLAEMGMISFAATCQFLPAMFGALFWRHGNFTGALSGLLFGFAIWIYTLLLPSLCMSNWLPSGLLSTGPLGIGLLKPTALFGLSGLDMWSHALFWSLLLNTSAYLFCSIYSGPGFLGHRNDVNFLFKETANGKECSQSRCSGRRA